MIQQRYIYKSLHEKVFWIMKCYFLPSSLFTYCRSPILNLTFNPDEIDHNSSNLQKKGRLLTSCLTRFNFMDDAVSFNNWGLKSLAKPRLSCAFRHTVVKKNNNTNKHLLSAFIDFIFIKRAFDITIEQLYSFGCFKT